jgi:hypothetical protein
MEPAFGAELSDDVQRGIGAWAGGRIGSEQSEEAALGLKPT